MKHAIAVPHGTDAGSVPQYWTPAQIADRWQVDVSFVRRIFRTVPGVLRLGAGKHQTSRVPHEVLERFEEERSR